LNKPGRQGRRATIKDVAAIAGISYTTVSHVVNKTRPVSEPVRIKVEAAIKQLDYVPSAVARSLKAGVTVPPDLAGIVEQLMTRAALDALSIAYKASQVAAGYARVEKAIEKDDLAGLIHAADAGADGTRKLDATLKRRAGIGDQKVAIIRDFRSAELDLALGRANVVHAALLAGRASTTFLARWHDLERFRMTEADGDRWGEIAGSPAAATEQLGIE